MEYEEDFEDVYEEEFEDNDADEMVYEEETEESEQSEQYEDTDDNARHSVNEEDDKSNNEAEINAEGNDTYSAELPSMDYVSKKYDDFMNKYRGNAALEDKWAELRSQINSGLKLRIKQKNIDRYATLDYEYAEREALKFFMWQGASDDLIGIMLKKGTYGEMVAAYDADKAADRASALLEKATANISQVLQTYIDNYETFKEEMGKKITEYKEKIEKMELNAQASTEKMNECENEKENLKKEIKNLNEMIRKEREEAEMEKEIQRRVKNYIDENDMAKPGSSKKLRGFFRKKDNLLPEQPKTNRISFSKNEKLPKDFNLSEYMLGRDLSPAQMEVITMAVKCNVSDAVVKSMIDSGKSSAQLKQVLEMILAKRQKLQHESDISEEDIIYDEHEGNS